MHRQSRDAQAAWATSGAICTLPQVDRRGFSLRSAAEPKLQGMGFVPPSCTSFICSFQPAHVERHRACWVRAILEAHLSGLPSSATFSAQPDGAQALPAVRARLPCGRMPAWQRGRRRSRRHWLRVGPSGCRRRGPDAAVPAPG